MTCYDTSREANSDLKTAFNKKMETLLKNSNYLSKLENKYISFLLFWKILYRKKNLVINVKFIIKVLKACK